MPSRAQMFENLSERYDVVIVGGGITGAGIARDAARRGLSVLLVEMNDLASGTSSRSSKLIHGGFRYLETYEFSLVFEAVSERRILMDMAPHLVNPLGFIFPVYEGDRRGIWMITAGMWLYDGLSLFRSPKRHRRLRPAEVLKEVPGLRSEGLKGAPLYYDCSTDDARLTLEVAIDATEAGACIMTHCRVDAFLKNEMGRVEGVVLHDSFSGALREVKAGAVINATGPWSDATVSMSRPMTKPFLRRTKGIHVVVPAARLSIPYAVVLFHPRDKRILFALPWGDCSYLGTTDTDYEGDPADVAADLEDVDYLLEAGNAYFPESKLTHDDVISTWAGLRPLVAPQEADTVEESQVSREHQLIIGTDGLITIAGGKLTTFRRMAAEVVDSAVSMLSLQNALPATFRETRSEKIPLLAARGWPENDDHTTVMRLILDKSRHTINEAIAYHLADNYGMTGIEIARTCAENPELAQPLVHGRPEIMAQIEWAVQKEFAMCVSDVMIRRTQLFYRDHDQGLGAIEKIADHMGKLLQWTPQQRAQSIEGYRKDVELSRRWKTGASQSSVASTENRKAQA